MPYALPELEPTYSGTMLSCVSIPTVSTPLLMVDVTFGESAAVFAASASPTPAFGPATADSGPEQPASATQAASAAAAATVLRWVALLMPGPLLVRPETRPTQLTWYLTPHSRTGAVASGLLGPPLLALSPGRPDASKDYGRCD